MTRPPPSPCDGCRTVHRGPRCSEPSVAMTITMRPQLRDAIEDQVIAGVARSRSAFVRAAVEAMLDSLALVEGEAA